MLSCSVVSDSLQPCLSMGFFRQEYWTVLPFPPPGDLPNPGIEPMSHVFLTLAGRFFTIASQGLGKYPGGRNGNLAGYSPWSHRVGHGWATECMRVHTHTHVKYMLNFLKSWQSIFHSGCAIVYSHQPCRRVQFASHLCQHTALLIFFFRISHNKHVVVNNNKIRVRCIIIHSFIQHILSEQLLCARHLGTHCKDLYLKSKKVKYLEAESWMLVTRNGEIGTVRGGWWSEAQSCSYVASISLKT